MVGYSSGLFRIGRRRLGTPLLLGLPTRRLFLVGHRWIPVWPSSVCSDFFFVRSLADCEQSVLEWLFLYCFLEGYCIALV